MTYRSAKDTLNDINAPISCKIIADTAEGKIN